MAIYEIYGSLATNDPPSPPDAPNTPSANDYLAARLGAEAWATAAEDTREKALVTASRYFDILPWKGKKSVASQPLAWPRTGVTLSDSTPVDSTYYPLPVTTASYELAFQLLLNPTLLTDVSQGGQGNIKRVKAGTAEVEFFKSTPLTVLPITIQLGLREYLNMGPSSTSVGKISGVTTESIFDDFRAYDIQGS